MKETCYADTRSKGTLSSLKTDDADATKHFGRRGHIRVTQKEGNSLEELDARQKPIPFVLSETNYKLGWKVLQPGRYCNMSDTVEFSLPAAPLRTLLLTIRPPEKFYLQSEGVKRDRRFTLVRLPRSRPRVLMGSSGS